MFYKKISLTTAIMLSVFLGITTGLFLGEWCRYLEIVGRIFLAIMQISVLPYIFVSLIQSFGSLDPHQIKPLAWRGGIMIAALWITIFLLMSFMPLTFPNWESAAFFSPNLLEESPSVDYVRLFIPSNPFNALANNTVPAVTIFSILSGIVLMRMERKRVLLDLLDTSSEMLSRLTLMLVKLSPIGIFALMAKAAGTMRVEDIGRIEVYLLAYVLMAALLFFLIMPLVLSALTPFGYRELMRESRAAMLTVLLTGNLFIVLPLLVENIRNLFHKHDIQTPETEKICRIIVPIAFILPCSGQLLDLIFILFSGWFSNVKFGIVGYLQLYGSGLLTSFGSSKVAIPFLLGMFRLPSDMFEIFLFSSVMTDNIKFTVEAGTILILAALLTAWMTGKIRWDWKRIRLHTGIIILVVFASLSSLYWMFNHWMPTPEDQRTVLNAMTVKHKIPFEIFDRLPPADPDKSDTLDRILKTKVLRVGFNRDAIPFTFFNDKGELVGFDIAMAGKLAKALDCVKVEFYPVEYDALDKVLNSNQVDIVMSQISISAERLGKIGLSDHYMELSMALLVPDYLKAELQENPDMMISGDFKIAALSGADYEHLQHAGFHGQKVRLNNYDDFLKGQVKADALMIAAENGSALTIQYPQYGLYIPKRQFKDLVAYAVKNGDMRFIEYLNFWIKLKRANGEIEQEYNYWIRGLNVIQRKPRWSILHDVILKERDTGSLTTVAGNERKSALSSSKCLNDF